METKSDVMDKNILEEGSSDFYHRLQTGDDNINACTIHNIEKCKELKVQDAKTELKTALLFHHEIFANLEELKCYIEEDLIKMARIEKSSLADKNLKQPGGDQEDDSNNHDNS